MVAEFSFCLFCLGLFFLRGECQSKEAETMCVVFKNLQGPVAVGSDGFGAWQIIQASSG